jgi:hypothetical protein
MSTSTITRTKPAEPAVLDADMTRADIIAVLQWIQFPRKGRVRDYLVGVLRDRSPAKS